MKGRSTFFRGSEFPRLILLGVVCVAGWIGVYAYLTRPDQPTPQQAPANRVPLPPADQHDELQGVVDRHALTPREQPGYLLLLERARTTPPVQLMHASRRDVLYGQVLRNPKRYRGVPIHLDGTAFRIQEEFVDDSPLFPSGVYYEAWVGTDDSRPAFWHIVFEQPPPNLPVGDRVDRRVIFDGYFFKINAYKAANSNYYPEPLLIGRLSYVAPTDSDRQNDEPVWLKDRRWLLIPIVIVVLGLLRWMYVLRRGSGWRPRVPVSSFPLNDEIDPETLSEWVADESEAGDDVE